MEHVSALDNLMDDFLYEASDITLQLVTDGHALYECEDDDWADGLAGTAESNINMAFPYRMENSSQPASHFFHETPLIGTVSPTVMWSHTDLGNWYEFELVYHYKVRHYASEKGGKYSDDSIVECITCGAIIFEGNFNKDWDAREQAILEHTTMFSKIAWVPLTELGSGILKRLMNHLDEKAVGEFKVNTMTERLTY